MRNQPEKITKMANNPRPTEPPPEPMPPAGELLRGVQTLTLPPPNLLQVDIKMALANQILALAGEHLDRSDEEIFFLCRGGLVHRFTQTHLDIDMQPTGDTLVTDSMDLTANPYWRGSTTALSWGQLFGSVESVDMWERNTSWRMHGINGLLHLIENQIARLDEFLHRTQVATPFSPYPKATWMDIQDQEQLNNVADIKEMSYLGGLYIEQGIKTIVATLHDGHPPYIHEVHKLWGIEKGKISETMNESTRSQFIKNLHNNPFFRYTPIEPCRDQHNPYPSQAGVSEYLKMIGDKYSAVKYLGFEPLNDGPINMSPATSLRMAIAGCLTAIELARDAEPPPGESP